MVRAMLLRVYPGTNSILLVVSIVVCLQIPLIFATSRIKLEVAKWFPVACRVVVAQKLSLQLRVRQNVVRFGLLPPKLTSVVWTMFRGVNWRLVQKVVKVALNPLVAALCPQLMFSIVTWGTRRSVLFAGASASVKLVWLVVVVGLIFVGGALEIAQLVVQ